MAIIQVPSIKTLFVATTDMTVTSTTASVAYSPIPTTGVGSMTLPANFFQPGRAVRLKVGGIYTTPATPGNVTVAVKLGSTTLTSVTVPGTVLSSSSTMNRVSGEIIITCRTGGSSGVLVIDGAMNFGIVLSAVPVSAAEDLDNSAGTISMDLTPAMLLDIQTTWSTTAAQGTKITTTSLEQMN